MECIVCGNSAQDHGMTFTSSSGDVWGACNACRADAALGRAVRRMTAWTFIYRNSIGWFCGTEMNQGTRTYGPKADTPEDALKAAGLWEVEK